VTIVATPETEIDKDERKIDEFRSAESENSECEKKRAFYNSAVAQAIGLTLNGSSSNPKTELPTSVPAARKTVPTCV
jgi:hypothetical protein